jgi:hypothetical protein
MHALHLSVLTKAYLSVISGAAFCIATICCVLCVLCVLRCAVVLCCSVVLWCYVVFFCVVLYVRGGGASLTGV